MRPINSDPFGFIRILAVKAFKSFKMIIRFFWIVIYSALPWPCLVYSGYKLFALLSSVNTAYAAMGVIPEAAQGFQAITWVALVLYTGVHLLHDWHDAMHRIGQLRRIATIIYVVVMGKFFKALMAVVTFYRKLVMKMRDWLRCNIRW